MFLISFPPLLAQVTYRGRPLSYYLLNAEAAGNTAQTCTEGAAPHCSAATYSQEEEEELTGLWKSYLLLFLHFFDSVSEQLAHIQHRT